VSDKAVQAEGLSAGQIVLPAITATRRRGKLPGDGCGDHLTCDGGLAHDYHIAIALAMEPASS